MTELRTMNENKIQLRRVVINAVIFIIVTILLDFGIGTLLRHFYFSQTVGQTYRTTYVMEKNTSPVLVMGASRANHHYDPAVLSKATGMEVYNAGRDGSYILYNYAVLKTILKRYSPKTIVYDVTLNDLQTAPVDYDRLSSLLPYYQSHPEIRDILRLRGPFERYKMASKIYPYNSLFLSVIKGNTDDNAAAEAGLKGFIPLEGEWNRPVKEAGARDHINNADSVKAAYYRQFMLDCKSAGTRLIIVFSPIYVKNIHTTPILNLTRSIAEANAIPFYDFSTDTSFLQHPEYFADPLHLNKNGAEKFTQKIAALLK